MPPPEGCLLKATGPDDPVNNPCKSTETYCSHGLASLPIIGIQYFKSLNWSFAQTAQVVKNL